MTEQDSTGARHANALRLISPPDSVANQQSLSRLIEQAIARSGELESKQELGSPA